MLKVISTEKIRFEHDGSDALSRVDAKIIALSWAIFDAHCERAQLLRDKEDAE